MIEVDGEFEAIDAAALALERAAQGEGLIAIERASDAAQREALWSARRALSPALRSVAPGKINEDVVVPVMRLPELVTRLKALSQRFELPILCFGHAGNGNLHVNLLYHPNDAAETARAHACLDAVFDLVLELGGMPSGEHGIGLAKRELLQRALEPETLAIMRRIKLAFDPDGILNPGKMLVG
jgi:D-lactate dehydrogenase (quinone)